MRFVGVQPLQQSIERGESGTVAEDTVEPRTQHTPAAFIRFDAVGLEAGVEIPDQRSHALLSVPVRVGERVQLMHQPFRVDPAQGMPADIELSGIVAQHHGIVQEAVRMDAAPLSPFGGNLHRVLDNRPAACRRDDPDPVQMRPPSRPIGKVPLIGRGQAGDRRASQFAAAHIIERRVVQHVIGMSGARQIEEVQPALRCARAEPGKAVIADPRAKPVPGLVPGTGISAADAFRHIGSLRDPIGRHPGRRRQPGA